MTKEKTAVDYLVAELNKYDVGKLLTETIIKEHVEKAKAIEKQQMQNIWLDSTMQFDNAAAMTYAIEFEQYFQNKFEQ
jgi:hypothetical protein